jgi:hypothetical protein
VPAKHPIHFNVDSKQFRDVLTAIESMERKCYGNRSKAICKLIREGHRAMQNQGNAFVNSIGYNPDEDDDETKTQLGYEATLPRINQPKSAFRFEDNPEMWRYMSEDLRNHVASVAHLIKDGVDKSNNNEQFKIPFPSDEFDVDIFCKTSQSLREKAENKELTFPNEEAFNEERKRLAVQRVTEEYQKYYNYINERVKREQQKTTKQIREERIAELEQTIAQNQDEIRNLTRLEEHENQLEQQNSGQEQTQVNNEISQS